MREVSVLRNNCANDVERRNVNMLDMKCSRSLVGAKPMDRIRSEDMCSRNGMEKS